MSGNLLEISGLNVRFSGARTVHAVNDLDLSLRAGVVLTILGESGSGKSVTLKALLRLLPERRTTIGGSMVVDGTNVLRLKGRALSDYRGNTVSMIFQEPGLALDPVYSIGDQIVETVRRHNPMSRAEARDVALDMLRRVRIPSSESRLKNYPQKCRAACCSAP